MRIEEIRENANVTSQSVSGEINRVAIHYDDYDFLTQIVGIENRYKGTGDDIIELDYHSEFNPLVKKAEIINQRKKSIKCVE